MVSANDLRRGMMIKVDNELYSVTGFQWTKPGKGGAFIKARLRNIKKNTIIEKTFRATEKIENIYIEKRSMQYLYSDGENSILMDLESFEQESISNSFIEEERKYLKDGQEVDVSFY